MTRFTFGAGSGTYARTIHEERTIVYQVFDDCFGSFPVEQHFDADFNFKDKFNDYGGEVDVQLTESVHIGIRGGRVDETLTYWGTTLDQAIVDTLFANVEPRDTSFAYNYFNPYFAVEKDEFGFGLGFVFSNNRLWTDEKPTLNDADNSSVFPTGHLRAGPLDRCYLKLSLWEGVPIYSGGGKWVGGIGVKPVRPLELFGGYATGGPYSTGALLLKANVDLGRHLALGANMRFSSQTEESFNPRFDESATSITLTYKLHYR